MSSVGAGLTRQQKITRGVWAAAFGAVIFVGAITGAQLKTDEQKTEVHSLPLPSSAANHTDSSQRIKQFRQTAPADQIAVLEDQKKHLMQQKRGLEHKVDMFRKRVKEREAEKAKAEAAKKQS